MGRTLLPKFTQLHNAYTNAIKMLMLPLGGCRKALPMRHLLINPLEMESATPTRILLFECVSIDPNQCQRRYVLGN